MISDILDSLNSNEEEIKKVSQITKNKVQEMCNKYPIYNEAF